jgi:hypothetical protein
MIPSPKGDEHEQSYEIGVNKHWYPFTRIPDVRRFEVKLNPFDPIFAMYGIRKRFSPTIEFEKFKNEKFNRYMSAQLNRLENARIGKIACRFDFGSEEEFLKGTYEYSEFIKTKNVYVRNVVRRTHPNPTLYFRIVSSLLKYSRVFFVRQLMLTEPK